MVVICWKDKEQLSIDHFAMHRLQTCYDGSMPTCHARHFCMLLQQRFRDSDIQTFLPHTGVVQCLSEAVCMRCKHSLADLLHHGQYSEEEAEREVLPAQKQPPRCCNPLSHM